MPSHTLIAKTLRERIQRGDLRPGDALPSYRQLKSSYGATTTSVRQAMLTLQLDGLVRTVPGYGSIVSPLEPSRKMAGLAFIGSSEAHYQAGEVAALQRELDGADCDMSVHFVPEMNDRTLASLLSWVRRLDGVILYDKVPVNIAKAVADTGTPAVLLGEPSDGPCPAEVANVTVDVRNMIHVALAHLVGLGHRRIVLCSCHGSRYFDLVTTHFLSCADGYGLGRDVADCYFGAEESSPAERMSGILKLLESGNPPPTALLVEHELRAASVIRFLNGQGWPVPQRISVLAISGSSRAPIDDLSMVVFSAKDALLRAGAMLQDMMHSTVRVVRAEKMPPWCVPGRTCRRIEEPAVV